MKTLASVALAFVVAGSGIASAGPACCGAGKEAKEEKAGCEAKAEAGEKAGCAIKAGCGAKAEAGEKAGCAIKAGCGAKAEAGEKAGCGAEKQESAGE